MKLEAILQLSVYREATVDPGTHFGKWRVVRSQDSLQTAVMLTVLFGLEGNINNSYNGLAKLGQPNSHSGEPTRYWFMVCGFLLLYVAPW